MSNKIYSAIDKKSDLRRNILTIRKNLSHQIQHQKSLSLTKILTKSPLFKNCKRLAAYWPVNGEIDPAPIIKAAIRLHKKCYLPVLHPAFDSTLWFIEFHPEDPLVTNRFGIKEPEINSTKMLPSWALDLILTPLVAFDKQGNRIGMGQRFYDNTFSFLKSCLRPHQPKLIGLAYEFQEVDNIKADSWDIPLKGIVTEKRFIISAGFERDAVDASCWQPEHPSFLINDDQN